MTIESDALRAARRRWRESWRQLEAAAAAVVDNARDQGRGDSMDDLVDEQLIERLRQALDSVSRLSYSEHVSPMDLLDTLRSKGVTRVAFHPDGALASVEFAPESAPPDDPQNETPAAAKRVMRPVGRLVPRGPDSA